ncbi:MAG: carboxypeptidase-like regulatory domain-containing protein [Alistipes sp.]|nr:carboxypeptidase-like regulatory domain-containing protein [Candidatus Minthomonas equi]
MKRYVSILSILVCLTAQADDMSYFRGKILDRKSKALPYASVFFKNHPEQGTVSDENGYFTISSSTFSDDTLIVSMLGYETIQQPGNDLRKSGINTFKMKEFTFQIDEAIIKASRNTRRQRKAEMKSLLAKIYRRATQEDLITQNDHFKIASDISVFRDSIPLTIDHLTGILTEIPGGKVNGKDSSSIEIQSYSNYMDSSIRNGINNFDTDRLTRKEKKIISKTDLSNYDKTLPHKTVWRVNDVKTVLSETYQDERNWDKVEKDDSTLLVSYRQKRGFIGIITMVQKLLLTVDSRNFAVKSMTDEVTVNINLPFAYKLSPAELEILNFVNVNEDDIEKFKIKKGEIHLRGDAINHEVRGRMLPSRKTMKNLLKISDRKDNNLEIENRCVMNFLR